MLRESPTRSARSRSSSPATAPTTATASASSPSHGRCTPPRTEGWSRSGATSTAPATSSRRSRPARSTCSSSDPSNGATRSSTARSPTPSRTGTSPGARASRRCRMIGEHWSPRSTELRDNFNRNHIPVALPRQRHRRRSATARRPRARSPRRCPVVVLRFTAEPTVLEDPSDIELADAFGHHPGAQHRRPLRRGDRRRRSGRARRRRLRRVRGTEDAWSSSSRRWAVRPARRR